MYTRPRRAMLWALALVLASTAAGAAEESRLSRAAPEQCLFYLHWSGKYMPQPDSKNLTEQLLADEEVQGFLRGLGGTYRQLAAQETTSQDASAILAILL